MKRIQFLIGASILSLIYNFIILLSVSLNMEWVRTRAAGGQYESFPIGIRIIYFIMASFMGTLIFWLWDHRNQILDGPSRRLARIFGITFLISTMLQLISRSPDERWNAIPAFILAVTFFQLTRVNKQNK
ncbi:MAG: hypothetical protein ACKO8C_03195 [Candidatus Nanopelagicaceae bacterium]